MVVEGWVGSSRAVQERNVLRHGLKRVCTYTNGGKEHRVRPNVRAAVNKNGILGLRIRLIDASQLVVHALGQKELVAVVALVGIV